MPALKEVVGSGLIAVGALVALLGAGEYAYSHFEQRQAREEWKTASSAPMSPTWQRDGAFARLYFPTLSEERFVLAGASDQHLRQGPAWMESTPPPGAKGNCVIAGHRDTHFRILKGLQRGDDIVVEDRAARYRYRIANLVVVNAEDTSVLAPSSKAMLTLVTCYPFYYVGPAPKRFIVQAELVETPAGSL
jgi:sortase A